MSTNTLPPAIMEELWSEKALRKHKLLTRDGELIVDGFVMHRNFVDHFDEDCALWLISEGPGLMRFPHGVTGWHLVFPEIPADYYPNYHPIIRASRRHIKGTKYNFVHEVGSDDEADEYVRDMRKQGKNVIPLGIGTLGPFNEHGQAKEGRARGDCTSLRVSKWSELGDEGCYRLILKEVSRADTEATQRHFELGAEIKRMFRLGGYNAEDILHMVFTRLIMAAQESSAMLACAEEFDTARGQFEVGGVRVCLIVSDSPFAPKYLRYRQANIVVKFEPGRDGKRNVIIQCRKNAQSVKWFVEIAAELCLRECLKKGMDPDETGVWVAETRLLAKDAKGKDMPGVSDLWHMFEGQLFNGTLSHSRPPTSLSYADIADIIKVALGRVPALGDVGKALRDVEMHSRKALALMADSGEGADAASEANLGEIEHRLKLALAAVQQAKNPESPKDAAGAAEVDEDMGEEIPLVDAHVKPNAE